VPAACSVNEAEGNDAAGNANTIPNGSQKYCGALSSAGDVDFAKFTLPADANYLAFGSTYTETGVDFDVTVDGKTFKVGETPVVKPGAVYTVKAYTTGKAPVSYKLSIEVKKQ